MNAGVAQSVERQPSKLNQRDTRGLSTNAAVFRQMSLAERITFEGPMTTISALAESFARTQRAERKSPHTIKTYRDCILRIGHMEVKDVDRRYLRDYFLDRAERCAPATVSIDFRVLRVFFKWCVREDELDESPMAKLTQPSVPVRPVPTFSDAELSRLLSACEGSRRDTAMLRLLVDTGMRLGELSSLKPDDINLEHRVAVVTGKGKTRLVSIGTKTSVALDRWMRVRPDKPTLFGLTDSGVYQALKDRANQAGVVGWHPHRHRHDMAHRWLVAGGSEGDLMALAGWSSRSLLDRYGASRASERALAAHRRMSLADAI